MEILSDDPTFLVGALGIVAAGFLVALRITQQGKFLIWALGTGALALVLLGIDWIWVTDNERIEAVVYDLRRAVRESDVDGVFKHLAPDIQYAPTGNLRYLPGAAVKGEMARALIRNTLHAAKFDFVRISGLETHAGAQTRRGTAEFQVIASGSFQGPGVTYNFGTTGSAWSLGLRETSPKVWQVERISPVRLPEGADRVLPSTGGSSAASQPTDHRSRGSLSRFPSFSPPGGSD